ncbi:MAG: universal stress protein [Haloferacaceae archaeon]
MALETLLVAVGTDDEERAERLANAAADVAEAAGATVVVGHVFTDDEFGDAVQRFGFDRSADELTPGDVVERLGPVRAIADVLEARDVDHEFRGQVHDGDGGVVQLAEEIGADQVFVGGRRRSPTGKAVFGSQAQEIMLNAPCPVTYVRSDME